MRYNWICHSRLFPFTWLLKHRRGVLRVARVPASLVSRTGYNTDTRDFTQ